MLAINQFVVIFKNQEGPVSKKVWETLGCVTEELWFGSQQGRKIYVSRLGHTQLPI
jgi:hypothetical protein